MQQLKVLKHGLSVTSLCRLQPVVEKMIMGRLEYVASVESRLLPVPAGRVGVVCFDNLRELSRYMVFKNGCKHPDCTRCNTLPRVPLRTYPPDLVRARYADILSNPDEVKPQRLVVILKLSDFWDFPDIPRGFCVVRKTKSHAHAPTRRIKNSIRSRTCDNCGRNDSLAKTKRLHCARCGQAQYCSKACQAADWEYFHKFHCTNPE